jgi:hypothetical protein
VFAFGVSFAGGVPCSQLWTNLFTDTRPSPPQSLSTKTSVFTFEKALSMKYVEKASPKIERHSVKNTKFVSIEERTVSDTLKVILLLEKRKRSDAVFNAWTNLDGNRLVTLRTSVKQTGKQSYQLKFNRRDLRMALSLLEQDADPSVERKPNDQCILEGSVAPDIKPS